MRHLERILGMTGLALSLGLAAGPADAEILAMMNYESKTADSLKSLKLSGANERREGIAIMDVDPASANFGKILMDIPLPADLVAHHIFYDRTMTKAYVTALGKSELRVMDLTANPYRTKVMQVPGCAMGEDIILNEDNTRWYLTCMNSANVFVGDVKTDKILQEIKIPGTYPHGLAVNTAIDRVLVTSTVSGDMKKTDEVVTVVEASTGKILGAKKLSNKPSPSGEGPVEILFVPGAKPAVAYVTNLFGGTLWTMTWNEASKDFDVALAHDFSASKLGVALEMYFNDAVDKLYVTTGVPGHLHIFDISENVAKPKLTKSLKANGGAHHVGITKDEKLAFVQNALLNLPGLDSGTITVVDLEKEEVVGEITTLADMGLNPNSLVLLPEWNHLGGH